jgi:hypothetical protein
MSQFLNNMSNCICGKHLWRGPDIYRIVPDEQEIQITLVKLASPPFFGNPPVPCRKKGEPLRSHPELLGNLSSGK